MFYMHGAGWGWWLLMSIGMVAFWSLAIWGIVALVRGTGPAPQSPGKQPDRPLEVLQRRLASGEISVEQYEELRDTLIGRPSSPGHVSAMRSANQSPSAATSSRPSGSGSPGPGM